MRNCSNIWRSHCLSTLSPDFASSLLIGRCGTVGLVVNGADGVPARWFSNLSMQQKHLGGLLCPRLSGPPQRLLIHLGWNSRVCISNNLSGDANAAGLGPRSEEYCSGLGSKCHRTKAQVRAHGDTPLQKGKLPRPKISAPAFAQRVCQTLTNGTG